MPDNKKYKRSHYKPPVTFMVHEDGSKATVIHSNGGNRLYFMSSNKKTEYYSGGRKFTHDKKVAKMKREGFVEVSDDHFSFWFK